VETFQLDHLSANHSLRRQPTGKFRLGTRQLIANENSESRISMEDLLVSQRN